MQAKRWLIDTPLPPFSWFNSVVEHCLLLTSNYSPIRNSSRSNFQKTIFLSVLRAWITALLSLKRLSCMAGTERFRKETESKHLCASNVISVYLRQTNEQHGSSSVPRVADVQKNNLKKLQVISKTYSCRIQSVLPFLEPTAGQL